MPRERAHTEEQTDRWFEEYKILMDQHDTSSQAREDETIRHRLNELRQWLGDEYLKSRQGELQVKKVFHKI